MAKFLIDVNLRYYFSLWNSPDYFHQKDINDEWADEQIWKFATEHHLTIITKDSDFSNKILLHTPPPKVMHIRFGNMKMKDFHEHMVKLWEDALILNQNFKLVNVFKDRIEAFE
jgi:predicted nuclease of predicted toxin-antitoxin system